MVTRATHASRPWGLRAKLATRCNPASLQARVRHPWRTRSAHAPSPVFHAPGNAFPIRPPSNCHESISLQPRTAPASAPREPFYADAADHRGRESLARRSCGGRGWPQPFPRNHSGRGVPRRIAGGASPPGVRRGRRSVEDRHPRVGDRRLAPSLKEAGLGRRFPEREKQDVFPAASMDGFTAVRKTPAQSGLRARIPARAVFPPNPIANWGDGAVKAKLPPPAASADKPASTTPPVAVVDGTPISRDAYDDYLKGLLRGKSLSDVTADEKNQVLDQMINMQLISTQAEKDGLDKDPEVATRIALLRTQILADAAAQKYVKSNEPSDQDLHAPYDAATDKTEYHASHILVPTKEKADQLIKKIKGGAKFEDVAKAESTDNSKANGGDLGWFTTARMVKPFGDAVKTLKKGEFTTDPVQTQYGWHIIKLQDNADAPFYPLNGQLTNGIMQKKFQDYIESLKKTAKIEKKL